MYSIFSYKNNLGGSVVKEKENNEKMLYRELLEYMNLIRLKKKNTNEKFYSNRTIFELQNECLKQKIIDKKG